MVGKNLPDGTSIDAGLFAGVAITNQGPHFQIIASYRPYIGISQLFGKEWGLKLGIGSLFGYSGDIALLLGAHSQRRISGSIILPIYPLYGTADALIASAAIASANYIHLPAATYVVPLLTGTILAKTNYSSARQKFAGFKKQMFSKLETILK